MKMKYAKEYSSHKKMDIKVNAESVPQGETLTTSCLGNHNSTDVLGTTVQ